VELGDDGGVVLDDDGAGGDDNGDGLHAVDRGQEPFDERDLGGAADAQDIQVRLLRLAGLPATATVAVAGPGRRLLHGRSRHFGNETWCARGARQIFSWRTTCSFILGVGWAPRFQLLSLYSYFGCFSRRPS
jgi:hypothetical protein